MWFITWSASRVSCAPIEHLILRHVASSHGHHLLPLALLVTFTLPKLCARNHCFIHSLCIPHCSSPSSSFSAIPVLSFALPFLPYFDTHDSSSSLCCITVYELPGTVCVSAFLRSFRSFVLLRSLLPLSGFLRVGGIF